METAAYKIGDKVIIIGKSASRFNDIPIGSIGYIKSISSYYDKDYSIYTVWDLNDDNWDFYYEDSLQISKKYKRKDLLDSLLID